jgi:hypothetical protein
VQEKRIAMAEQAYANTVAVFERHEGAEAALRELQHSGVDMQKLSILGHDPHTEEHPVGFYTAGAKAEYWGTRGAFWGMIVGILFAPAFFWIPGVGFVLVGGLVTSFILGTLEGAAAGAAIGGGGSALVGALTRMGIPKESVIRYERSLKADKFILIARGTLDEATRYREILEKTDGDVALHPDAQAGTV